MTPMTPPRIVSVVGARPQFVKASVVSRAIAEQGRVQEVLLHTGQHHDPELSEVFFTELAIPEPAWNLGIASDRHGRMTARMLEGIEDILVTAEPAAVLVYGDTNSTLAGALAAAKLHLPVVHVEAGLRSFNRRMPEEVNRVLTDHLSALLLVPTAAAVANLAAEGIQEGVHHVGDVMFDASLFAAKAATATVAPGPYAVATVHRAENTDDPDALSAVIDYLREEASTRPVLLPLHPRTRAALARFNIATDGLTLLPPLGYLEMAALVRGAEFVLTDSGGLQKEAYFHGVPCVTLRTETEWVETVAHGWNRLWTSPDYETRSPITEYGDGTAGATVARLVAELVGA